MGRLAIIIVMALVVTVGVISFSLNKSKTFTVENVAGFEKYTSARNFAHAGVNLMLHRLDVDTTYVSALNSNQKIWLVKDFNSGLCSVSIQLKSYPALDTVNMLSKAIYGDTVYRMHLTLQRFPKPFPSVGAAVNIGASPMAFDMNGAPRIDGRDHLLTGGLTPSRTTDTTGVAVTTSAESTLVSVFNSKLTGDPTKIKTQPVDDPALYVNEYILGADYDFPNGVYSSAYGSATAPVIGYAHGNVKFNGTGSFYGVLVVDGNLELAGSFNIYGLVICSGVTNTITTSSGTPMILGGIILPSTCTSFTMSGNSDMNYSTEALRIARFTTKLLAYKVMKWYE
jgi:hypothetical protein